MSDYWKFEKLETAESRVHFELGDDHVSDVFDIQLEFLDPQTGDFLGYVRGKRLVGQFYINMADVSINFNTIVREV